MTVVSYDQFLKKAGGDAGGVQLVTSANPAVQQAQPQTPGYASGVANAFKGGISKIGQGMQEGDPTSGNGIGGLVSGVGKILGGAAGAITSPITPAIDATVGKVIGGIGNQIGNIPQVQQAVANHPRIVNAVENIAGTVGDYDAAAGLIAGGVGGPKVGGLVSKVADVRPAIGATGRLMKGAGEGAYGLTVPMKEGTKIAVQDFQADEGSLFSRVKGKFTGDTKNTPPVTEANTAARHGLTGTEWQLGVQAKQVASDLWTKDIAPKLEATQGKIDIKSFFDDIEKEIRGGTQELGNRNSLLEGLQALREDYKNVRTVSLPKLQGYKEGWAKFLPDAVYKGKPVANSLKAVKDLAAKKARQVIYESAGDDIKQSYIDYGNLQSIAEAGRKSVDQLRSKGVSKQVWEFILDKLVTPVATMGGRVLYKTGDGLEFVGNSGATKIKDIVGSSPSNVGLPLPPVTPTAQTNTSQPQEKE